MRYTFSTMGDRFVFKNSRDMSTEEIYEGYIPIYRFVYVSFQT